MPQAEIDPVDRFQARTGRHSWLPRVPLFVAAGDIGRQFESAHQLQKANAPHAGCICFLALWANQTAYFGLLSIGNGGGAERRLWRIQRSETGSRRKHLQVRRAAILANCGQSRQERICSSAPETKIAASILKKHIHIHYYLL